MPNMPFSTFMTEYTYMLIFFINKSLQTNLLFYKKFVFIIKIRIIKK